jgi:hypothetical protein
LEMVALYKDLHWLLHLVPSSICYYHSHFYDISFLEHMRPKCDYDPCFVMCFSFRCTKQLMACNLPVYWNTGSSANGCNLLYILRSSWCNGCIWSSENRFKINVPKLRSSLGSLQNQWHLNDPEYRSSWWCSKCPDANNPTVCDPDRLLHL